MKIVRKTERGIRKQFSLLKDGDVFKRTNAGDLFIKINFCEYINLKNGDNYIATTKELMIPVNGYFVEE